MSSLGAPKKMLGIKSKKVWVMDMDMINKIKASGDVNARKNVDSASSVAATRLI